MYKFNLYKKRKFMVFFAFFVLFSSNANAHPHGFVELETELLLKQQDLVAVRTSWVLDELNSSSLVYDINNGEDVNVLLAEMMFNIVNEHYFSYLYKINGKDKQVVKYSSLPQNSALKINAKQQAKISFDFMLAKPLPMKNNEIELQTYDSTYYIAMNYLSPKNVKFSGSNNSLNCKISLKQPNVAKNIIDYAKSLDKTQRDEDYSLGENFAQTIIFKCN